MGSWAPPAFPIAGGPHEPPQSPEVATSPRLCQHHGTRPRCSHPLPCEHRGCRIDPLSRTLQRRLLVPVAAGSSVRPVPLCRALLNRGTAAPCCLSCLGCVGSGLGEQRPLSAVPGGRFRACCRYGRFAQQLWDPRGYSPSPFPPPAGRIPPPPVRPPCIQPRCPAPTRLSPAHTAGTRRIYIPNAVQKGTLAPSPPHQYLRQARTPAQLCRGRRGAELGATHPAPRGQPTKAPSEPPRCLPGAPCPDSPSDRP